MSGRLLIAIVSTIAEEATILIAGVWLLPKIDINIPLLVILVIMVFWLGWSIFTYRKGTHALLRKPIRGMVNMTGSTGIVVKAVEREGLVKIQGELWGCRSESGNIEAGTRVKVITQDGLKLVVRPESDVADKRSTTQ